MGHILVALGRRDEGITYLRRAIVENPGDQLSKDKLRELGVTP